MRAANVRQNIAPVVVMLNEIALREADTERLSRFRHHSGYVYGRDGVVLSAAPEDSLYPVRSEDCFVQRCWRKRVRPVRLERPLPVVVQRGKSRNRRCSAVRKESTLETAIDAVALEDLIGTHEILRSVSNLWRAEGTHVY